MPPAAIRPEQWFGVKEADMGAVLPNRANFPDLFSEEDLFGDDPAAALPLPPTEAAAAAAAAAASEITGALAAELECQLSNWTEWTGCSLECGSGIELRTRTRITNSTLPPALGCPALADARACNTHHCQYTHFELAWSTTFDRPATRTTHSFLGDDFNQYGGAFASSATSYFIPENLGVADGVLTLAVTNDTNTAGRPWSGSGLNTNWRHAQTFGRWEVTAQMPSGYGTTGYIGLFAADKTWPPEIDFAE
jgi:hypothetical protein